MGSDEPLTKRAGFARISPQFWAGRDRAILAGGCRGLQDSGLGRSSHGSPAGRIKRARRTVTPAACMECADSRRRHKGGRGLCRVYWKVQRGVNRKCGVRQAVLMDMTNNSRRGLANEASHRESCRDEFTNRPAWIANRVSPRRWGVGAGQRPGRPTTGSRYRGAGFAPSQGSRVPAARCRGWVATGAPVGRIHFPDKRPGRWSGSGLHTRLYSGRGGKAAERPRGAAPTFARRASPAARHLVSTEQSARGLGTR
jgi:hypothetical protein